jgi:hypothetical protein
MCRQIQGCEAAGQEPGPRGGCDHGRVVGGESHRRESNGQPALSRLRTEPLPQFAVGGDAAGNQNTFRPQRLRSLEGLSLQVVDHSSLERRDQTQRLGIAQRECCSGSGQG